MQPAEVCSAVSAPLPPPPLIDRCPHSLLPCPPRQMADITKSVRRLGSRCRVVQAATQLAGLSGRFTQAAADVIVAEGAVPPLLALLSTESTAAQQSAVSTLWKLARVSSAAQSATIAAGGAQMAVRLLGCSKSVQPEVLSDGCIC